jgi:hypothetical protein
MSKSTVSAGDGDVPDMHPVWGDVGPVTALGKTEKELNRTKWELLLVQETLKKSRELIAELEVEVEMLKGWISAGH